MPKHQISAGGMSFEIDDPDGTFLKLPQERQSAIVDDYVWGEIRKMPVPEFRQKFPEYKDMPDEALANALQTRFGRKPPPKIVEFEGRRHTFPGDFSDADISAALSGSPVATDIAKSGGVGLGKGLINAAGTPGDVRQFGGKIVDALTGRLGASPEAADKIKSIGQTIAMGLPGGYAFAHGPTSEEIQKGVESQTGEFYKPRTTYGKYAGAAAEFAGNPLSYAGPGGAIAKAGTAVLGGLGSEAAGQATEGTAAEPYARAIGAGAAGLAPSIVGRAITPLPATAARQRLVDALTDEGVTSLTAGQRTNRPALRYAESALGDAPGAGAKASAITQRGQEQFTEAALRRAGTAGEATPEVLAANQQRLGDTFRDLSARNTMYMDTQFLRDLGQAGRNYQRVPPSQQRAIVEGYVGDIVDHFNAGRTMAGGQYQEMRSRLSRQANSLRQSDPTLSEALRDMRNALDDAMGRSIAPADRELWQATRREYGAQKVIEKAASRAGEATAEGQIVPANLRNTVAAENRGAYARGEGQFSELARAGAGVMGPMPQSGTGPRAALHAVASLLGGAIGGGGGMGVGTGAGAIAGAVAGPAIAGRALMSAPVQGYLGNQVATPLLRHLTPRRSAIVNALIAAQSNQQRATR